MHRGWPAMLAGKKGIHLCAVRGGLCDLGPEFVAQSVEDGQGGEGEVVEGKDRQGWSSRYTGGGRNCHAALSQL